MPVTLPVLALQYPTVILPGARIALPVDPELGQQLVALMHESDTHPVLAAVPIVNAKSAHGEAPVLGEWGCASRIMRLVRPSALNQSDKYVVSLQGLTRVRLARPIEVTEDTIGSLFQHPVVYPAIETTPGREAVSAFKTAALKMLDQLIEDTGKSSRKEVFTRFATMVEDMSDARVPWLADVMVWSIITDHSDRLDFLTAQNTEDRLKRAVNLFVKHTSISEVSKKIASAVDESLSKQQKEYFLRQQLVAIQRELASLQRDSTDISSNGTASPGPPSELDQDEAASEEDMADIKRKIEAMEPGTEERKMGVREWRRLKRLPQQSVEYGVIRSYLEWLVALPWPSLDNTRLSTSINVLKDRTFLTKAKEQLDADHYGLDKIKRRLIEYLAVVRLRQLAAEVESMKEKAELTAKVDTQSQALVPINNKLGNAKDQVAPTPSPHATPKPRNTVKGPILLFVGPPGTGKTSLGQSIAHALDRPFQRISLGGVRDEAEIRGHRRTYVASGPGVIVQALRKAGRPDPILLLDEVDKVGPSNYHGDVSSALLEVLDPEQNHSFNDHYISVPVDLSQVLFICTANTLDTISAPLLDRCEVVHLSGYTYDEKVHIARRFLLSKQLRANALDASHLSLSDAVLRVIATQYTREAGVRSLERAVGAVVRAKAVEWAEAVDAGKENEYSPVVEEEDLEPILGIARWDGDEKEREDKRGVVYGLVVMGQGEGGILPVETTAIPGSGRLKLTGSLGEVIKESGELALSWVKTHAYLLHITNAPAQDPLKVPDPIDIHLHLPAGAQKKDGPSAGVAMTCAFVSLLSGAIVSSNIAMSGEITLRGRVTPVGGIKEKVLGAHRANITKVILPYANRKDVEQDVPREVRDAMEFVFVRTVEEALNAAFGKGTFGLRPNVLVESRL
ncbi:ATP-dependent protease La [Phellopilus nigrolimitatus]|nr:ATP-dependent protease La [Phellopilus nigrolimitatus]